MTTGAWYVEGKTLHLLLPNYRAPVLMENLQEALKDDPLYEVLDAPEYEFVSTEYTQKVPEKEFLRSLLGRDTPHLVIEYKRLLAGKVGPKNPDEGQNKGASGALTGEKRAGF